MSVYTFASHEQEREYHRLCLIQDAFDEKSRQHLLKAGLKKGMACLEVGVGAGSVARWMYEQVAPEGSVLGVDLSADFIKGSPPYDLLVGDILDLDIRGSFDFIHVRYVLIHNKHAAKIIEKLFSLLRTNGVLLIEEPDFTLAKWIDAREIEACKRVNSAICKMFEQKGLKPYYGSIAHLSLVEAGFRIEEAKPYLHLCSGNEAVAQMMALSALALENAYMQTGICSQDDIDAYTRACKDIDSLGVYYATVAITAVKEEEQIASEDNSVSLERSDGVYLAESDAEIAECFSLMQQLRPHLEQTDFISRIRDQMKEGYLLYYLSEDGKAVALCGCRIGNNLAWGKHLYVDDLITEEEARSTGHGKRLLEHLVSLANRQECKEIHLDSGVQRFLAHKFYLRENFKIVSHHFSKAL